MARYNETVNVVGKAPSGSTGGEFRYVEQPVPGVSGAGNGNSSNSGSNGGGMPWWEVASQGIGAATGMYNGKQQAKASRYATDRQMEAAKAQMAYTQQQDYQAALAAEAAQRGNYEQWRAGQQTSNDLLQAREQRLGNLAGLIGAGPRAPITTTIPDYVPSPTPRRPTGSNTLRSFLGE